MRKAREGLFKSMKSFLDYLAGVRAELSHVKWPTTAQAIGYTVLVIFISLIVAALLSAFDYVFTFLIEWAVQGF